MTDSNRKIGAKLRQGRPLSEKVADILLAEIQAGTIKPGQTLPPEAELGENFGVSRTVIREALARLKSDGLLETQQGRGATLVESAQRSAFRLEAAGGGARDPNHLFELRAILEGDAAALAAWRRSRAHIRRLRDCLERMQAAVADGSDGTAPDFEFHRIVAEASGNPYLLEFMKFLNFKLVDTIRAARTHSSLRPNWPQRVQKEHVAICDAIAEGNADRARTAMIRHITNASRRLGLDILGRSGPPTASPQDGGPNENNRQPQTKGE